MEAILASSVPRINKEVNVLLGETGVGKRSPNCPQNHPLEVLDHCPLEYNGGGVKCDQCLKTVRVERGLAHCSTCGYDLCTTCAGLPSASNDEQASESSASGEEETASEESEEEDGEEKEKLSSEPALCGKCHKQLVVAWRCVATTAGEVCADCATKTMKRHVFIAILYRHGPESGVPAIQYIVEHHTTTSAMVCEACHAEILYGGCFVCHSCPQPKYFHEKCLKTLFPSHAPMHMLQRQCGTLVIQDQLPPGLASAEDENNNPMYQEWHEKLTKLVEQGLNFSKKTNLCKQCRKVIPPGPLWCCCRCKDYKLCSQCVVCASHPSDHAMYLKNYFIRTGPSELCVQLQPDCEPTHPTTMTTTDNSAEKRTTNDSSLANLSIKVQVAKKLLSRAPECVLSYVDNPSDPVEFAQAVQLDLGIQLDKAEVEEMLSEENWRAGVAIGAVDYLKKMFPHRHFAVQLAVSLLCKLCEPESAELSFDEKLQHQMEILFEHIMWIPNAKLRQKKYHGTVYVVAMDLLVWKLAQSQSWIWEQFQIACGPRVDSMTSGAKSTHLVTVKLHEFPVYLIPFNEAANIVYQKRRIQAFQQCHFLPLDPSEPSNPLGPLCLFVSHRWRDIQHPDADGDDFRIIIKMVEDAVDLVLLAVGLVLEATKVSIPDLLVLLQEVQTFGRTKLSEFGTCIPEYALRRPILSSQLLKDLLTRALSLFNEAEKTKLEALNKSDWLHLRKSLRSQVYLWYDYCCLPQEEHIEGGTKLNSNQRQLVDQSLRNLSVIQSMMHTIVVNSAIDYLTRAWCVAEWLNGGKLCSMALDSETGSDDNFTIEIFQALQSFVNNVMVHANPPPTGKSSFCADILDRLHLNITYQEEDSKSVCCTLWSTVQKSMRSAFFQYRFHQDHQDKPWAPSFSSKANKIVRYQRQVPVSCGRDLEHVVASLHFLQNVNTKVFEDWNGQYQQQIVERSLFQNCRNRFGLFVIEFGRNQGNDDANDLWWCVEGAEKVAKLIFDKCHADFVEVVLVPNGYFYGTHCEHLVVVSGSSADKMALAQADVVLVSGKPRSSNSINWFFGKET